MSERWQLNMNRLNKSDIRSIEESQPRGYSFHPSFTANKEAWVGMSHGSYMVESKRPREEDWQLVAGPFNSYAAAFEWIDNHKRKVTDSSN